MEILSISIDYSGRHSEVIKHSQGCWSQFMTKTFLLMYKKCIF